MNSDVGGCTSDSEEEEVASGNGLSSAASQCYSPMVAELAAAAVERVTWEGFVCCWVAVWLCEMPDQASVSGVASRHLVEMDAPNSFFVLARHTPSYEIDRT